MLSKRASNASVTESSGNVFADLGFSNPEEELAKAQLASRIPPEAVNALAAMRRGPEREPSPDAIP